MKTMMGVGALLLLVTACKGEKSDEVETLKFVPDYEVSRTLDGKVLLRAIFTTSNNDSSPTRKLMLGDKDSISVETQGQTWELRPPNGTFSTLDVTYPYVRSLDDATFGEEAFNFILNRNGEKYASTVTLPDDFRISTADLNIESRTLTLAWTEPTRIEQGETLYVSFTQYCQGNTVKDLRTILLEDKGEASLDLNKQGFEKLVVDGSCRLEVNLSRMRIGQLHPIFKNGTVKGLVERTATVNLQ